MKEKLIIKNFGPIKTAELSLGRFTILIGEQATGKSTVAKVLAVCRYFSYIIDNEVIGDSINSQNNFTEGLISWGLTESLQENSYINYECLHYSLVVENSNTQSSIPEEGVLKFKTKIVPKSEGFINLLSILKNLIDKPLGELEIETTQYIPISFYQNEVKRVMDSPFYLPAQRGLQSIFSIGKNSIANLSDALFNQLARMDHIARMFKKETYIEPLDIYYINRDGHGFIRKATETKFYSLFNAASGYQSLIPIVLVTKYYNEIRKRKKTFILEEPEQNLFPLAQHKLMHYVIEKANDIGSSLFISTQSPYILTSLNNMMFAHQIGKLDTEKTNAIIDKKYWVNPADVAAYMMKADGTCISIIDDEGLIQAEQIDSASNLINTEFDKIMNVEIGIDEAY